MICRDQPMRRFRPFKGCRHASLSMRFTEPALFPQPYNPSAAGFVTDGRVRDYDGIVPVGLPVWCTGLTPGSPHMSGPGSVGFPIQIGGQQVETGDLIVADRDGVVVVPIEKIDNVVQKLEHIAELEKSLDQEVASGLKVPRWVEEYLASDKTVRKDRKNFARDPDGRSRSCQVLIISLRQSDRSRCPPQTGRCREQNRCTHPSFSGGLKPYSQGPCIFRELVETPLNEASDLFGYGSQS